MPPRRPTPPSAPAAPAGAAKTTAPIPNVQAHAVRSRPAVGAGRPLTKGLAGHIVNPMVNYQEAGLDRTFAALADPTRRALLARLDEEESVTVSELARPFPVSLPAIMKHL